MHRLVAVLTMAMLSAVPAYADKGGVAHEGSSGVGREATLAAAQPPGPAGDSASGAGADASGSQSQGGAEQRAAHSSDSPPRSTPPPRSNARAGETGRRAPQGAARRRSDRAPAARRQGPKPKRADGSRGRRPVTGASVPRRGPAGRTTICHATGSAGNPYVLITISDNALAAHRRHQDGRDIIPAPAGGCPASDSAAASGGGAAQLRSAEAGEVRGASAGGEVRGAGAGGEGRRGLRAASSGPALGYGVLGATVTSGPMAALAGEPGGEALRTASASPSRDGFAGLPFTGLQLAFVLCSALAALLLGTALFRATRPRPPSGIHPFG